MSFALSPTLEAALEAAAAQAGAQWPGVLSQKLLALCEEVIHWNARVRLVGYECAEEVLEHLVLEALYVLAALPAEGAVLDAGSGAGFPGLVLAAARPALEIASAEARGKKVHFQKHAARFLGLRNFEAREIRLDPKAPHAPWAEHFKAATAQALAAPAEVIALLAPYLAAGGRLVLPRGPAWQKEKQAAHDAAHRAGLALVSETEHTLPLAEARRIVAVFEKR